MFGLSPKSDFNQALKAFGHFVLDTERPVILTPESVTPDFDKLHSLQDEFLSHRYHEMGLTEADARQATQHYIDSVKGLSAPIVSTTDPTPKEKAILMTWGGDHLGNYIAWLGIKKSFEQSGITVLGSDAPAPSDAVWVRDTCFVLGSTAFLPDTVLAGQFANDSSRRLHERILQHDAILRKLGLRTMMIEGCYFEGGNLNHPPYSETVFWGGNGTISTHSHNNFCDAIYDTCGIELAIRPVPTDSRHYHLDIGLSPRTPSGHHLVSKGLGYRQGSYESAGLEAVRRHVSRDKLIELPRDTCLSYFLTNSISIGNTLFMTGCPDDLRKRLEDLGNIVNAPTEEQIGASIHRYDPSALRRIGSSESGGGLRCMTQEIPLLSLG